MNVKKFGPWRDLLAEPEKIKMKKPRVNAKYPWPQWFSKKKYTIVKGVDYHCQTHSMMQQIRTMATGRGVKVTIHIQDDSLIVENKGKI